jgi:hypothetical protein
MRTLVVLLLASAIVVSLKVSQSILPLISPFLELDPRIEEPRNRPEQEDRRRQLHCLQQ